MTHIWIKISKPVVMTNPSCKKFPDGIVPLRKVLNMLPPISIQFVQCLLPFHCEFTPKQRLGVYWLFYPLQKPIPYLPMSPNNVSWVFTGCSILCRSPFPIYQCHPTMSAGCLLAVLSSAEAHSLFTNVTRQCQLGVYWVLCPLQKPIPYLPMSPDNASWVFTGCSILCRSPSPIYQCHPTTSAGCLLAVLSSAEDHSLFTNVTWQCQLGVYWLLCPLQKPIPYQCHPTMSAGCLLAVLSSAEAHSLFTNVTQQCQLGVFKNTPRSHTHGLFASSRSRPALVGLHDHIG